MTETPSRPMVFIATPCFGGLVSQHYMQSVISLIQFASQANFGAALALLGHDSLITCSRKCADVKQRRGLKRLARDCCALDGRIAPVDHLQRIDPGHKVVVEAKHLMDLRRLETNVGIDKQQMRRLWCAQELADQRGTGNEREREGRFATAIYCGGGFMLLKRQVIERMIMAYTKACTPIPMPRAPKVMPYSTA